MPIPANIDMDLIREAMARRAGGGMSAGGAGMPVLGQATLPQGQTPMGGPNVPIKRPAPATPQGPKTLPPRQQPVNQAMQAGQLAQGPGFDEETKRLASILIKKLVDIR